MLEVHVLEATQSETHPSIDLSIGWRSRFRVLVRDRHEYGDG